MKRKVHPSMWLVLLGSLFILAGLGFVPADIEEYSVPLRVVGNVLTGSGVIWFIFHFGRIK